MLPYSQGSPNYLFSKKIADKNIRPEAFPPTLAHENPQGKEVSLHKKPDTIVFVIWLNRFWQGRAGDLLTLGDNPVFRVNKHHRRNMVQSLGLGHPTISCNYDQIAHIGEVGCRAVNANHLRPGWGAHGISAKSGSPGHIPNMDLLEWEDSCRLEEVIVQGQATFVVKVGLGDRCPVDFGL